MPWTKDWTGGTDKGTEALRQLIWSRMFVSIFTVGVFSWARPVRGIKNWMLRKNNVNIGTLGRGAESVSASMGIRMIQLFLGSLGMFYEDYEEDEDFTQLYRLALPMFMSVIMDSIKYGDPTRTFRIFSGWMGDGASTLWDYVTDED